MSKGYDETAKWSGKVCLENEADKLISEHCLDRSCFVQSMILGHSGGQHSDPKLQSNERILYGWTGCIYRVGSTFDYRSICEGGLIAGRMRVSTGTTDVLLHSSGSHERMNADISIRTERTEENSIPIEMGTNAWRSILVSFGDRAKQRMGVLENPLPMQSCDMIQCQLIAW